MVSVSIIKYSERSIAVIGDTKPIKDLLKQAGGGYNSRLTDPQTQKFICGWVFSLYRQNAIESLLRGNGVNFIVETPANVNEGNYRDYIQDPAEIDADNFCRNNNI